MGVDARGRVLVDADAKPQLGGATLARGHRWRGVLAVCAGPGRIRRIPLAERLQLAGNRWCGCETCSGPIPAGPEFAKVVRQHLKTTLQQAGERVLAERAQALAEREARFERIAEEDTEHSGRRSPRGGSRGRMGGEDED